MPSLVNVSFSVSLLLVANAASAQSSTDKGPAGGIYSCTDGRGRTITSDRPIPDCSDREQRELNPSGTTRRRVEPTYTAKEQAEREERQRQMALVAARQQEERRRERALLIRYPDPRVHDRERVETVAHIDALIESAKKRLGELGDERRKLDDELEFYKNDVRMAPLWVRRALEGNTHSAEVQNRFVREQEGEKRRLIVRFDEERAWLQQFWSSP